MSDDPRFEQVRELVQEIHGHGADTLEGEILRLRDILNRIDAVSAVTEPTPRTTGVHSPEIAEKGDGTFGVFCSQCSREAGDYIYPCKLGRWQAPPIVAAVPTPEPTDEQREQILNEIGKALRDTEFIEYFSAPRSIAWRVPDHDEINRIIEVVREPIGVLLDQLAALGAVGDEPTPLTDDSLIATPTRESLHEIGEAARIVIEQANREWLAGPDKEGADD